MTDLERLREKARHNEAQALYHARQEGKIEGISEQNIEIARNALRKNMAIADIVDITGLSYKDVEKFRATI